MNFAAKRMADMLYVSGLDRETADRHFRWRPAAAPGDLASRPVADDPAPLIAAHRAGDITIETDDADRGHHGDDFLVHSQNLSDFFYPVRVTLLWAAPRDSQFAPPMRTPSRTVCTMLNAAVFPRLPPS